jgi:hypothetical protein
MGMNKCSPAQVRELVPAELHKYLPPNMQKGDASELVSYDPQTMPPSSSPVSSPPYSSTHEFLEDDFLDQHTSSAPSSPNSS